MIFDRLIAFLKMEDPSDYEEYYENTSWKTFRIDESIWNESPYKRPKISYYRELQVCYLQLLEELGDSFLYDVTELKNKFNEMHIRNCELEKQLAIAAGNNQILQERLDSALKWQTAQGRKNEVYESQGLDLVPVSETQKDGYRFTGKTGTSMQDNMMLAAAYFENSWALKEIADTLQVSENTVRSYVSTMRKHYKVQLIQGRKHIVFDSEYGEADWDLCLYERMSVKFPEKNTIAV